MAQFTFINLPRRDFLKNRIRAQWNLRNAFKYSCEPTDSLTMDLWCMQVMSSEANPSIVASLKDECKKREEELKEKLDLHKQKIEKFSEDILRFLKTLRKQTLTFIPQEDSRFSSKVRWQQNTARQTFRETREFREIDNLITILEEKQDLEPVRLYLVKFMSKEMVNARIILSESISVKEFSDTILEFRNLLEQSTPETLKKACDEMENKLYLMQQAIQMENRCREELPNIMFKADTAYRALTRNC